MKRTLLNRLASLPALASAIFVSNSCIFEKPEEDDFYRTLWQSDEIPLGPLGVNSLTLEFLCNGDACITLDETHIIYGSYSPDGNTTVLNDMKAYVKTEEDNDPEDELGIYLKDGGEITVTFLEAHRDGDTLFLLWRVESMLYPFTTALHRLTDYK